MWALKELLSAFRFLTIRTDAGFWQSKRVYELALPLVSAILIALFYYNYSNIFNNSFLGSMASNVFQFMVFVVPFHLAALGAFSTFQTPILDEPLKGVNAELKVWDNQDNCYAFKSIKLRQYVSLLFGYLCTIGVAYISLYIFFSAINLEKIISYLDIKYITALLFVFVFFLSHYVFLSVYAVTFLFEKVVGIER